MARLEDVDATGVHLVGAPANRRRFALVKNLAGRAPQERTMKKAAVQDLLAKHDGDEVTADDLVGLFGGKDALLKALGLQTVPLLKSDPPDKDADADDAQALAKAIGLAVTRAIEPLTTDVKQLKDAREHEQRSALQKRAGTLKDLGYDIDVAKATAPEVAALEKAHERVKGVADRAGLTKAFGTPRRDEPAGPSELVTKAVREHLGREPLSPEEDAKTRQVIFRRFPGLLSAVTKDERRQRALAAS